jgi:hypothetical protein
MSVKEVTVCPIKESRTLKGFMCKKCKHFIKKTWYEAGKPVDLFCDYHLTAIEKQFLK